MGINLGDGRLDGNGAYIKRCREPVPSSRGTFISSPALPEKKSDRSESPGDVFKYSQLGSMYIEVTGNQMDLSFIQETGAIEDHFTIIKQGLTGSPPGSF